MLWYFCLIMIIATTVFQNYTHLSKFFSIFFQLSNTHSSRMPGYRNVVASFSILSLKFVVALANFYVNTHRCLLDYVEQALIFNKIKLINSKQTKSSEMGTFSISGQSSFNTSNFHQYAVYVCI